MAQKKYRKRRNKGGSGNHDVLGITLIVISAFLLLCIVIKPILGVFSEAIFGVMLGVFGIASYPLLLATLFLGIFVLKGRTPTATVKSTVGISLGIFFALIILQLASTHAFLSQNFSSYIDSVYSAKYSVGGVIMGLIAFGLKSLITEVACYIVFSIALIVDVLVMTSAITRIHAYSADRKAKKSAPQEPAPATEPAGLTAEEAQRVIAAMPKPGLFTGTIERSEPEFDVETGSSSDMPTSEERSLSDYYDIPVMRSGESGKQEKRSAAASAAHYKLYSDSEAIKKQAAEEFRMSRAEQPKPEEEPVYAEDETKLEPAERVNSDAMNADMPRRLDYDGTPNNLHALYFPPEKSISFNDEGIEDIDEIKSHLQEHTEERMLYDFVGTGKPAGFAPPIFGMSRNNAPVEQVDIIDASKPLDPEPVEPTQPIIAKPEPIAPIISADDRFLSALHADETSTDRVPPLESDKFKPTDDIIDAYEELNKFGGTFAADVSAPEQEEILDGSAPYEPEPARTEIAKLETESPINAGILDGSLVISDAPAVDLTERDFDNGDVFTGQDLSGVYIKADDKTDEPAEPAAPKASKRPKPNAPLENQITIDTILKEKAEESVVAQDTKKYKRYNYAPPPVDLLKIYEKVDMSPEELQSNAQILEDVVSRFLKTQVKVINIVPGPQVTRYELDVPSGTSVKAIETRSVDIAYELAAPGGVRVEAPIRGKRAVGIEVPNRHSSIVGLREVVDSPVFAKHKSPMVFSVGKDVGGEVVVCDLEKIPHLLIAGQTGSGKSAGLNSLIVSLLYKASPDDLRFILVDPKRVEFSKFRGMPHSLFEKTITEPNEALNALKWAENEMNRRYTVLSKYSCSKLSEYNSLPDVKSGKINKLPHIVIIVDELANLMMSAVGGEIESKVSSIAALARAAGIHLIVATQRPSADVITGTIKANLTSRIAFRVPDATNSRIILDVLGAESLSGNGDMLFFPNDAGEPKRVQGSFVSGEEVLAVVNYIKDHYECDFDEDAEKYVSGGSGSGGAMGGAEGGNDLDPLASRIMAHAIKSKQISTSVIQRRFSIGYARAARIIDNMEDAGFIGPSTGNNKPRDVLMTVEQYKETFGHDLDDN